MKSKQNYLVFFNTIVTSLFQQTYESMYFLNLFFSFTIMCILDIRLLLRNTTWRPITIP